MNKISKDIGPIDLWLSLHDTSPRVRAARQAVYCHTSFPFMKVRMRDFRMDWKIPVFSMLTKYAYKLNVKKNRYLIVQQEWMRRGLCEMTGLPSGRIIVAPPSFDNPVIARGARQTVPMFFFPSTPDCHKNFELLCGAAEMLEHKRGKGTFRVVLTLDGTENRYSRWLYRRWGNVDSISFNGFLSKSDLYKTYSEASCLVFPSRSETWGLPISEFAKTDGPMILADLPYARETAAGSQRVAFTSVDDAGVLAALMEEVIDGAFSSFRPVRPINVGQPYAPSWDSLFKYLLEDESPATR